MAFRAIGNWFSSTDISNPRPDVSRHGLAILPPDSVSIENRQQSKMGEGVYAKVYAGWHNGKERAVKVFKEHLITTEKAVEEFKMLNSLKHPNMVRVYGMWVDPYKDRNALAIVMEICDSSLKMYIMERFDRGISREKKLQILRDITSAMIYLHGNNIIHGDLRTPNVLVVEKGDSIIAKLTDFGMARVLDPESQAHITTLTIDDSYLPPEVFSHQNYKDKRKHWAKLTPSVDVFCFGPIAIELGCGEFPKPTAKVETKNRVVVRTYSEIERREKYMLKIKPAERMCTGLIIEQCLAERPEERGSFLDLQIIIESFQRKYNKHPDRELLEEKQLECELLRSKMEADQVTLYNESLQELELEESKTLIAILKERVAKLEQVVSSGNSELIHLANQLKVERQQHEALQSENDLMKRERDSLKEEKAIAMQEMEDAQKRHKMELQDLQDNLLQLQQNRNEMTGEIGKLKEELALQKKFTEQKERSWESLQNEYDHLVDALKRMEREQEKRRIQLLTQKERFQAKEEEFKSKIEEITTALESNLSTFQGEKKELDLKVAKKERVIHQKEQEIAELKRSKEALSGEVEEKERELVEMKKKLEKEVARSQENQKRMKQAETTCNEMARLSGTLQSEVSELKRVLNDQEASASEKKKELQEKLKMAEREKQRFAEEMKEEERVQSKLQKMLDQQKEKWESEVFKANTLTERIHFLDTRLKEETVRSTELQAKTDHLFLKSDSLKRENAKLESENTDLRITKALFGLHQEECEKYKMSSIATQESTATALSQLKEENQSLFTRCDCLQVENTKMCEKAKTLRASHNELQGKLETLEGDLEWNRAELVRLEQKEQSLSARRDELEREKNKLVKENEGLKFSFESTHSDAKLTESEVDLEDLERQEEQKSRVEQIQVNIVRLKELAKRRSSSSDNLDQGKGSLNPAT